MPPDVLREVEEFVRTHPLADAARSAELQSEFRAGGLANWWLPKAFGGLGLSLEDSVDVVAALAYGDAGFAFTSFVSMVGTNLVSLYGDERLRADCLRQLVENGGYCATLGSERAVGSELDRMATSVVRCAGTTVVNGEKLFSTNAELADFLVVFARSDGAGDPPYAAVVLPRATEGVHVGKRWNTVGLRTSPVYQVSFADCAVPAGNMLDGHGLRLLEIGLNASRILIAATALGMARRIRDLCLDYAKGKTLKGSTLVRNALFADKLAQMEVGIEAMRNQCKAAARDHDAIMAGPDPSAEFSRRGTLKSALIAKLFCGQTGWRIVSVGSEVFGGLGYTDESPIGDLVRDMRYVSLVEGGDDVLRELVYKRYVVPASKRS